MSQATPEIGLSSCSSPASSIVYAWLERAEHDALALEESVHGWRPWCSPATPLAKPDDQQWECRIRSKTMRGNGITVVFCAIDYRPLQLTEPQHKAT